MNMNVSILCDVKSPRRLRKSVGNYEKGTGPQEIARKESQFAPHFAISQESESVK
jgi:hypothetical protein